MNHTLSKITNIFNTECLDGSETTRKFYLKAGMGGASSQSVYNQRFDDTDLATEVKNEHSMFQTAIVPLKLEKGDSTVCLKPNPSSPHFFRSLHLQYQKETKGSVRAKELDVREQIESLQNFKLPFPNKKAKIEIKIE